jgi:hypothetical protein
MNFGVVTIATFPLRLVGLDPGRARANAEPGLGPRHRKIVKPASVTRAEAPAARHRSTVGTIGPEARHRANVGEGRPG